MYVNIISLFFKRYKFEPSASVNHSLQSTNISSKSSVKTIILGQNVSNLIKD